MNKADMPTGVDEPGAEPEPEMSNEEMRAALKKAMETIAAKNTTIEAQNTKIKAQKRTLKDMDAHLRNKTLPSKKRAQAKSNKKKKTQKKPAGQNAKSKKKRAETSSEESDGGWNSDQSETEESEEDEQATTLHPDDLADAVIEYCNELKKTTKIPKYMSNEIEMNKFISLHYEECQEFAEEKTGFKGHGLRDNATFIRKEMMGAFAEETETIDPKKPENCQICLGVEVRLLKDKSNFRECIFECSGQFWTPCKRISPCQNAICFKCSNMPETWRPQDDFWCRQCNTDERKATTKEIEEGKTPVDMFAKPEKPPEKVKEDLQVVNVFGGGGGKEVVTMEHARKLFELGSHVIPSFEQMNRSGTVWQVGNFDTSRKCKEKRAAPEEFATVKFLPTFETKCEDIQGWANKSIPTKDIFRKIDSIFTDNDRYKERAMKAIEEISVRLNPLMHQQKKNLVDEWIEKIDDEMEDIALGKDKEYKEKKRIHLIKKANKIIKQALSETKAELLKTIGAEVKKNMCRQTHCMDKIKANMKNILELMRIVRNTTDHDKFNELEARCNEVWDDFECDPIKEKPDEKDDIDDEKDDSEDDMVDHAGDNEED